MAISPNSEVHLLNVPLEIDYKDQIYFSNKTDQANYFKSKKVHSFENLTYQRKENWIRVPKHIDDLYNCNYVMYRNNNYTNRWFYAFITRMEYKTDECTHIFIETDVYQTWLFDVTIKKSFVEREHVMDDTIGLHTIPEGLETGEYKCNKSIINKDLASYGFVVASHLDLVEESDGDAIGSVYNGVYSGYKYYYCGSEGNVDRLLEQFGDGQTESVACIFVVPAEFIYHTNKDIGEMSIQVIDTGWDERSRKWNSTRYEDPAEETKIFKPTKLDDYTPKNNKLFTFPYCYLNMSNNAGSNAIYHYESFKNPDDENLCDFNISSVLTPGMSIRCNPLNYDGVAENNESGLNGGKYPICSWSSDIYTNWLTQNGINIGLSITSGLIQIGSGVAMTIGSGGVGGFVGAGAIGSGLSAITGVVSEMYQHSLNPKQAEGNINSGDVTLPKGNLTFTAYQMTIKKQFAECIDNYFEMFGYKVNALKVPNLSGRPYWNYVKTIDINIDGAIPSDDMQKLKSIYNKGVTLWKNGNLVGDYSQNNH